MQNHCIFIGFFKIMRRSFGTDIRVFNMPIYEYVCQDCGHELEAIQKISEEPLKKCPQCEAESLRKKISAAGFRLKGGGWYETDFKSGKKKNVAGSDAASSSSDTSSGSSSSSSDSASSSGTEKSSTSGTSSSKTSSD